MSSNWEEPEARLAGKYLKRLLEPTGEGRRYTSDDVRLDEVELEDPEQGRYLAVTGYGEFTGYIRNKELISYLAVTGYGSQYLISVYCDAVQYHNLPFDNQSIARYNQ